MTLSARIGPTLSYSAIFIGFTLIFYGLTRI